MSLQFSKTDIDGLMIIKPHHYKDDRGIYLKYFEKQCFLEQGLSAEFSESSEIISHKGTLRGLHYQCNPSQGKLLHVVQGAIFDVVLDLRKDSDTFGQHRTFFLYGNQYQALYIPENFAHGFLVLENDTIFSYQCTGKYVSENSGGIIWNDKNLNISWPMDLLNTDLIISEKDKKLQDFESFKRLVL